MADETGSQNTPQGGTQPPSIDYGKIATGIHHPGGLFQAAGHER